MKQMSTGASNDFERATKLARDMVTKYGMSDKLGTMVYTDNQNESTFGMPSKTISEATQQKVDSEVRRILDEQYAVARKIIEKNKKKVEVMAKALLEYETIDAEQINDIMAGKKVREPKTASNDSTPKNDKGTGSGPAVTSPQPTAKTK
jgi:cell division protease FtsH